MESKRHPWKLFIGNWRPTLAIALPIFILAVGFGIWKGFPDLILYAIAMALGAWHIATFAVIFFEKLRLHQRQNEEALMPKTSSQPMTSDNSLEHDSGLRR